MMVILEKILPPELEARGLTDADAICANIVAEFANFSPSESPETPDAIFDRLGKRE